MVLGLAHHSETLEKYVVYQELNNDKLIWLRPYKMFVENIIIDGNIIPRFKFIKNNE